MMRVCKARIHGGGSSNDNEAYILKDDVVIDGGEEKIDPISAVKSALLSAAKAMQSVFKIGKK